MMTIECRGDERKEALLRTHRIREVLAVKMPNVRTVQGCCGPVTDVFHFFSIRALEGESKGYLVMGPGCARSFTDLSGAEPKKRFTPELSFMANQPLPAFYHNMCELNQQLHDAIFLLCMAWKSVPSDPFLKIIDQIYHHPDRPAPAAHCRLFAAILKKDRRGRDLAQIMADLRKVWPNLRWFQFNHLEQAAGLATRAA